jgi:uncharacterized membrane-anchored protein
MKPVWIAPAAFAALAILALPFGIEALAQANEQARAEMSAAIEAAEKAKVTGPSDIKLIDQAVMKLPKGFLYVPEPQGSRLLAAMGNRPGEGLLGMIFPEGNEQWFVVMRFIKSGYVKDDDAKDWKADELLKGIKEGTEEANSERRARGLPEIEVVGWIEPPAYDAKTHRLVWSLSSKQKNEPAGAERGVNYNTYALGRQGYISLNLVTGENTIQKEKPVAHQLLAALEYNESRRYGDFNSATDHVAEFGLAALVGGIAAKKLGLFALIAAFLLKFWKILAIAVVALLALLPRLFGRKKQAESAPPPPPA